MDGETLVVLEKVQVATEPMFLSGERAFSREDADTKDCRGRTSWSVMDNKDAAFLLILAIVSFGLVYFWYDHATP